MMDIVDVLAKLDPSVSAAYRSQAQRDASDLSPHVNGGPSPAATTGANSTTDADARATLHLSAAIVLAAIVALWLLGAFVLKGVN